MIIQMTSGGYKIFDKEGNYIGAYNNKKLADKIDELGRPLTKIEFDKLFKCSKKIKNAKR